MMRFSLAVTICLVLSSPAYADIITINANDYPLGTDLSSMFPGITINRIGGVGTYTAPPATTSAATVTGSYDPSSRSMGSGNFNVLDNRYTAIELLFNAPTSYLQMDFIWLSDTPMIYAFNSLGQQVDFGYAHAIRPQPPEFTYSQLALNHGQSDIARVIMGGLLGTAHVTKISYETARVPEPGTLGLIAMGMLGATFVRKRRR